MKVRENDQASLVPWKPTLAVLVDGDREIKLEFESPEAMRAFGERVISLSHIAAQQPKIPIPH